MTQLSVLVLSIGLLLYLDESSSENPSLLRAGVFAFAVIEASLCMAFSV